MVVVAQVVQDLVGVDHVVKDLAVVDRVVQELAVVDHVVQELAVVDHVVQELAAEGVYMSLLLLPGLLGTVSLPVEEMFKFFYSLLTMYSSKLYGVLRLYDFEKKKLMN